MSTNTEGIQINHGGLREAIAASLNRTPSEPAVLQQPEPVVTPEPAAPAPSLTAPEGTEAAAAEPQTNHSLQPVEGVDDFELDLSRNPLEEIPAEELAPVEQPMSRREAEEEFRKLRESNPRFNRIYDNHVQFSKLAAPPEEGGIGFRPDADQVREWHQSHATMDQMIADFSSGDPNAAKNFVDFWMGKDAAGTAMRGADQFVEALPTLLAQSNPDAYQKIGAHFNSSVVNTLSEMAENSSYTEQDKARLLDAANIISRVVGVVPTTASQGQPAQTAKPNDEVAALRQRIAELEGRGQQQSQESIRTTVTKNFDTVLERDADAALKPLKDAYANQPLVYDALRSKMVAEMRGIAMRNPAIRAEINKHVSAMTASGNTGQLERVIRLWRQGYADSLPAVRTSYLKAAGVALTRSADESRAVMQQAQSKTAPGPGTAPSTTTKFQTIALNPGETSKDATRRILSERFAALRG